MIQLDYYLKIIKNHLINFKNVHKKKIKVKKEESKRNEIFFKLKKEKENREKNIDKKEKEKKKDLAHE